MNGTRVEVRLEDGREHAHEFYGVRHEESARDYAASTTARGRRDTMSLTMAQEAFLSAHGGVTNYRAEAVTTSAVEARTVRLVPLERGRCRAWQVRIGSAMIATYATSEWRRAMSLDYRPEAVRVDRQVVLADAISFVRLMRDVVAGRCY